MSTLTSLADINEQIILSAAQRYLPHEGVIQKNYVGAQLLSYSMVSLGLAAVGYQYVNVG